MIYPKMNPALLSEMFFEASKKDPDGGIPGKAPYVITKSGWWPLGFGDIEPIADDFQEGDYEFVIHPDRTSVLSLEDYGKTWIIYDGPENEPFWSAIVEFQKVPLVDVPDNPREDNRKAALEAKGE